MAAPVARGPLTFLLQSSSGQYVVLGMGAYTLFPDQVKVALRPILQHPAILATFGDLTASHNGSNSANATSHQTPNIIIQTPSPTIIGGHNGGSLTRRSLTTVLIYSVAGAGACWVGYIVCSQLLPDAVSEFMPVTKRLFKETSQTLGKGILQVKEILESQITQLLGQQQQLQQQQDATHKSVKEVQDEVGHARKDLATLQSSLDRCEAGLDNTQNMQSYTLRGIKLLVRCVTSFMPDESTQMEDIHRFVEESGGPVPPPSLTAAGQSSSGTTQANGTYPALPVAQQHRTSTPVVKTTATTPMIYQQHHHQPPPQTPQLQTPKIYATSPATPMMATIHPSPGFGVTGTGSQDPLASPAPNNNTSMESDDLSSLGAESGGPTGSVAGGGMSEIRALLGQ